MTLRACLVQAAPVGFELEATLDKVDRLADQAAAGGTDLIVFPEAFVSAYPKGLDFGVRVGQRSDAGRSWFERYHQNSVEVPGPVTERLGELAQRVAAHLVIGVIERDGGTLYCTALMFAPDGTLLGRHRKLVPTAMERVVWGCGDGSTLTVAETAIGRLGTVICWENYMPLLRAAMYSKGVELDRAPTVDDRESWIPTMRHIAMEGRCYVLSCCQFATRRDYPADYPIDADGSVPAHELIRGGSCIVDPFGTIVAGPVYGSEAMVRAELDPGAIVRGKFDLDVVGHYARPDVFRLTVDERPRGGGLAES